MSQSAENDAPRDYSEQAMIAWLVETLHYPFNFSFDPPPPVDHDRLADYWNEHDRWGISAEEARSCVRDEAGLTRPIPPTEPTP